MNSASTCFHCEAPIPATEHRYLEINNVRRDFCCAGCEAVAGLIAQHGLTGYYDFRLSPSARPLDVDSDAFTAFDRPQAQRDFVHHLSTDCAEACLLLEGLRCSACGWLIENTLIHEGAEIRVNTATGRALLRWNPSAIPLSKLLSVIQSLGYIPHPLTPGQAETVAQRERRQALGRLGVAGFGMMQVMMVAVPLYAGAFHGIEPVYEHYMRLISLLITTPVVVYSAQPFFRGAWRGLRLGQPGMDLPVTIGIILAFTASLWNTLVANGEVYFDSVTMFIFFLTVGRFFEMTARHEAGVAADALAKLIPATACRINGEQREQVLASELNPGDRVVIIAGAVIPADGQVLAGHSRVDEAILTGESEPASRRQGDRVHAGTTNLSDTLQIQVDRAGPETVVAHISRLLARAEGDRPRLAHLADQVGHYFTYVVLILAAAVYSGWSWWDPSQAFAATLAVLVVSCPCALALATPAALVTATTALLRRGVLVTKVSALETLAKTNHLIFDKTGTLTEGRPALIDTVCLVDGAASHFQALAAALERDSRHPIANAFHNLASAEVADQVIASVGAGIEGVIGGRRWRLGTPAFVSDMSDTIPPFHPQGSGSWILLGNDTEPCAWFRLADRLRPEVPEIIKKLQQDGYTAEIASGDGALEVAAIAHQCGDIPYLARMTPEAKLNLVRRRQAEGKRVVMVGDGVNDAPVLSGADVAIAMGSGSALAQTAADLILLGGDLTGLPGTITLARQARHVVRQNLLWALIYNTVVVPLAAAGMIAPWLAAIGMSASSLLVIANARQLLHNPTKTHTDKPDTNPYWEGAK